MRKGTVKGWVTCLVVRMGEGGVVERKCIHAHQTRIVKHLVELNSSIQLLGLKEVKQ